MLATLKECYVTVNYSLSRYAIISCKCLTSLESSVPYDLILLLLHVVYDMFIKLMNVVPDEALFTLSPTISCIYLIYDLLTSVFR